MKQIYVIPGAYFQEILGGRGARNVINFEIYTVAIGVGATLPHPLPLSQETQLTLLRGTLIYFWVRGFQKCGYFFEIFEFFPIFWKNQNFDFFSEIQFLKKMAENLSTYSNYEFLQIKNIKSAINASENNFQIC